MSSKSPSTPNNPIRVLLADDHVVVLQGVRGLLDAEPDIEVVAVAHDGAEVLDLLPTLDVDVVVMDAQMPMSGMDTLAEIRARDLPVRVVLLTAFGDGNTIQTALELGAEGFALKTESPMQLVEAIRQVAHGRLIFPRAAQKWLMGAKPKKETPSPAPSDALSPREWDVIEHIAQGKTNPEVAHILGVSENTVRFHLKNIYSKINVANRTEAAAWYLAK